MTTGGRPRTDDYIDGIAHKDGWVIRVWGGGGERESL